jgi:hypothetical protein
MNKEELDRHRRLLIEKVKELQQENKQIKEKTKYDKCFIYHLKEDKKDLQQRIDKAIEYIKENCTNYYVEKPNYRGVELINIEELLEILGDKE